MRLAILLVAFLVSRQDQLEVKFFSNGNFYVFDLPKEGFAVSSKSYTEGTFRYFKYPDSSMVILHVGGNVVKPFLKKKEYKVLTDTLIDEVRIRKGYNKKTDLYWEEHSIDNDRITILFKNVEKGNVWLFEKCLNSLRIKEEDKDP